ncbi:MAG: glycine zipper 2TM domain-containing protein, partial [Telluria sp.]
MNTTPHSPGARRAMHPMMILAAIAVILFCLAGTAAIMGWIPSSVGGNAPNRELTEADRLALTAQMTPAPASDQRNALADSRAEQENRPLARDAAPRRVATERAPVTVASAAPAK